MSKVRSLGNRNLFFLLFALSGVSGLVYESIWTHYLKLFLGHAAYAQSLVLAIFMGGLAIGSYISSRYSPGWKNLLKAYALTEGLTGLMAFVFHEAFGFLVGLSHNSIFPALGSPTAIEIFKWTLSSLLIFPQTVLLGMTFPLMSAGIIRVFPDNPGKSVSLLYFANSIGAVIGVLVSGFVLIPLVGLPGTIRTAGIINIFVALIVLVVIKDAPAVPAARQAPVKEGCRSLERKWFAGLLGASLVTGAASFIYEIGWIRMLSLVLGSSTHSFELMLSSFILGLALGGLWIQRRIDRLANPLSYLSLVQVLMGIFAVSTLPVYGYTFEVMQWLLGRLDKNNAGYLLFNLSSHALALVVMLPATFCAGMTLPLITLILFRRSQGERSIGAVYAANTTGAIVGVFFAIHVGMPVLGLKALLTAGAALDILLGAALVWGTSSGFKTITRVVMTAAGAAAIILTGIVVELDPQKMSSGVYRDGKILRAGDSTLVYHKDGKTSTVSLNYRDGILSIRTNGKVDAGIRFEPSGEASQDESTMVLLAALPLSIYPEARTVANIGFGSGLTTHTFLGSPFVESVDTIEIEERIVEGARNFGTFVERAYSDARSRIYIEDAKTFFSSHKRKYDIIVSEPSNPWVSGVGGLFSEEFYSQIKRSLSDRGLFVQWVQLYEIDLNLVASIFKALSPYFDDYAVYAPNDLDLVIIAGNSVGRPGGQIFQFPALYKGLNRIGVKSLQDIEIRRIGGKRVLADFFNSFQIRANSDYYPVLDQNAPRSRFIKSTSAGLLRFTHEPLPALEMLEGPGPFPRKTKITYDFFFSKTDGAATAIGFRDYFLGLSHGTKSLGETQESDAALAKMFFSGCGTADERKRAVDGAFNIAVQMIPYLTAGEAEEVWKVLESGSCNLTWSGQEKEWISLFHAVSRRDAVLIARHSQTLLGARDRLTEAEVKYLIAAGMLGSIVSGEKGACRELWAAHRNWLYRNGEPHLIFPLLASRCP